MLCRYSVSFVTIVGGLILAVWCPALYSQKNWPEFRGPKGDGQAVDAKLPGEIGDDKNIVWKTPIHGKGWSSPVIWDGQIWLTTATKDGKTMSALCVDLESGKVLRDLVLHRNKEPAFCHPTNSFASPTPAIEKGRVYLHFGSYGTTCLDTKTGKQIWQRTDLECDHHRGPASSPILFDDKLIVAFDGFDVQYVVALNKENGKTIWKTERTIDYGTNNGDLMKAYGTGKVIKVDDKNLLVYPTAIATEAYDVKTGDKIWTVYHGGMNASARPLLAENGLLIWTNGMGRMVAVKPNGKGDITKSHVSWSTRQGVAKKSSQLVIGNRLYMVNDMGIASCLDIENGDRIWQQRLKGNFSSSPIFDGEKIFVFSEGGDVHVFKPGDEFERVSQSKLGDGFKASPAVSGNRMIVRSFSHLYCIGDATKPK